MGDSFPQGRPLGGMVEPGSCAAEGPPFGSNIDLGPRRHGANSMPVPPRAGRFITVATGLDLLERANHNLRCAIARAVAEYLERAATYLRQPRGVDVLVLGAARTAGVIDALGEGARQLGTVLPPELAIGADRLRGWARTLKQQAVTAEPADEGDVPYPAPFVESP